MLLPNITLLNLQTYKKKKKTCNIVLIILIGKRLSLLYFEETQILHLKKLLIETQKINIRIIFKSILTRE